MAGNYFGFLGDKNINVSGGNELIIEDNFVELLYGNPIIIDNLKQTRVKNNNFGFQVP